MACPALGCSGRLCGRGQRGGIALPATIFALPVAVDDELPQRSFDAGNTWEKVQVDHASGFRALSAQGFDVWVGGRNGVLYHSTDLGLHWTRVTPMIEGAALSADIVRIEFTDSLRGKITTADNQFLVTSDGGKSWQKQ